MVTVKETLLPESNKTCFTLSEPFDTKIFLNEHSKSSIKLNLVNIIDYYDIEHCEKKYNAYLSENNSKELQLEDFIAKDKHRLIEGIFLKVTIDDNYPIDRDAVIKFTSSKDKSSFELSFFFAPYKSNEWYFDMNSDRNAAWNLVRISDYSYNKFSFFSKGKIQLQNATMSAKVRKKSELVP